MGQSRREEGERLYVLSKARSLADSRPSFEAAASTCTSHDEARQATIEAAPAYLRTRLRQGLPLPVLELRAQAQNVGSGKRARGEVASEREVANEEERGAVLAYIVSGGLNADLYIELVDGLTV